VPRVPEEPTKQPPPASTTILRRGQQLPAGASDIQQPADLMELQHPHQA
jgi:hypothetical protein